MAASLGFKSAVVTVQGRRFQLLELSALQRVDYLQRCAKINSNDGYQLIRDDLAISADLIALHQRSRVFPRWLAHRWRVQAIKRLPVETIATLFKRCVALSNIPFDIQEEPATDVTDATPATDDDDWDYLDAEKK
ncbi:MAG: hypothetical protein RPT11_02895 [Bermanella sp.]